MGRNDTDELSAAQILYPCMQCADIFFLEVLLCVFFFMYSSIVKTCLARELSFDSASRLSVMLLYMCRLIFASLGWIKGK